MAKDPILKRYAKAKTARERWNPILADGYRMALPGADPTGGRTDGAKTDAELYEGQGMRSVVRRRARMHGQLFPPFDRFLEFEFEGLDLDALPEAVREQATARLDGVADQVEAAIAASNFHIEVDQALGDALVSVGAIQLSFGTPERPLVFEAIPIADLVPEPSTTTGLIETVFRERQKVPRRDVPVLWPDADLPTDFKDKLAADPDGEVALLEAQVHDPVTGEYDYLVYLVEAEHALVRRRYRTKRIIAFRLSKFSGEVMGRGPVLWTRADLLTANKLVEVTLKNASIAVAGIWQADDDGVLNPANIKLVPGSIIPKAVGSAGLQPLQPAARFDVSQLVQADLRAGIKETIEGPPLPPLEGDRRTKYEFLSRERELSEVEVPQHLRIFFELDQPLWRAVIDILANPALAGTPCYIDLLTLGERKLKPVPKNPLVRLQRQAEAMRAHQAFVLAMETDPATAAQVVDVPAYIRGMLEDGAFPTRYLRTRDQMQQLVQQQQQQQQQQAYMAGLQHGMTGAAKLAASEPGNAVLQAGAGAMGGTADG